MQRAKKPDAYKTPLRSRKVIADFLLNGGPDHRSPHADRHGTYVLAWNVKLYDLELDFDRLVEVHKGYDSGGRHLTDAAWLKQARQVYEKHQDQLEAWAIEDACGAFDQKRDSDTFFQLWDGTPVDVEYGFIGRSGGWLVIKEFNGICLIDRDCGLSVEDVLFGRDGDADAPHTLPYADLRKLYTLVRMLDNDVAPPKPSREVEHAAAFTLFENLCTDVPLDPLPADDVGAYI